jgi:PAS domain S-box-containing protein
VLVEAGLERSGVAPFYGSSISLASAVFSVAAGIAIAVGLITVYTREVELARREAADSTQRAIAVEHELANLVRFSPDGMAVLDGDGVIELANEAMACLAGRTATSLVGLGLADLPGMSSEASREAVLEGIARLHERGESLWMLNLIDSDGVKVPVEVHARFVARYDGKRKVQLVVRDMSFRADAAKARDRLEAELREARRLQGLGRFAGGIAHDFRNLLTPIIVNVGMLKDSGGLRPEELELAKDIDFAAQRANALTQQLLAFARRQRLELRAMDLNQVVREIEPILRRLVRGDIVLHFAFGRDLGAMNGDRTQLEQVLVNLVANARDAMPSGGTIRIETGNSTVTPEDSAHHSDRRAGEYVALTVADSGGGMPEEVRRHIFEPFYTTKGNDQGTGLGLATVHGIVVQCGGYVEVESAVGRGTVFRVLLPRVDAVPDHPDASIGTPAAAQAAARILVVDDDELVRGAVARTLRGAGHRVTEASNGKEALEIARGDPARFDLLVTDMVMPNLAGRDLASALRADRARHPVLFMSGYADDEAILDGREPETDFLHKPFSRDGLLAKVAGLLPH